MIKQRILWMLGGGVITVVVFVLAQQFVFGTSSAEQISKDEAEEIVRERISGEIDEIKDDGYNYAIQVNTQDKKYQVIVNKKSGEVLDIQSYDHSEEQPIKDEETQPSKEPTEPQQEKPEPDHDQENQEETMLSKDEVADKVKAHFDGEITSNQLVESETPYFQIVLENQLEVINLEIDARSGEILHQEIKEKEIMTPISKEQAIKIANKQIKGKVDDIQLKKINGTLYFFVDIDERDATIRINALDGNVSTIWENEDLKQSEEDQVEED